MKKIWISLIGMISVTLYAQEEKAPNIIFILADDLGYGDTEPYGQKIIKTPNISKLSEEGMHFTNFYSSSSVCAPARASIITGQTTGEGLIRGNKEIKEPIDAQMSLQAHSPSIAKMLKSRGYNTGVFGKWALGSPVSEGNPISQGFDTFFGYNSQFRAHRRFPAYLWENNEKYIISENDNYKKQIVYSEDLIQQKALEYIEKQSQDKPFFIWLTYTLPHAELVVPKDSIYQSYEYLPKKTYKGIDYDKVKVEFPHFAGYMSQEHTRATFAAMVSRLDVYLGQIRTTLQQKNLDKNTIIIFASDNGSHKEGGADPQFFNSSGGLKGYKRDLYEGGIRTPFIVYWKDKIKPKTVSNHIGAFYDLYPTFAEIAGSNYKPSKNQVSFLPTLLGKRQKKHKYLYWEFHEEGGRQAVRFGKWKGIRQNVDKDKYAPIELYNLETDPSETTNIAEKYPKIVKKIASFMEESHTRSENFPYSWEK